MKSKKRTLKSKSIWCIVFNFLYSKNFCPTFNILYSFIKQFHNNADFPSSAWFCLKINLLQCIFQYFIIYHSPCHLRTLYMYWKRIAHQNTFIFLLLIKVLLYCVEKNVFILHAIRKILICTLEIPFIVYLHVCLFIVF